MDLTHHFHVPSNLEETWAHFQDVAGLAGCFPGAQVISVDGDDFTGSCKVKLGPIALVYNGTGKFTERNVSAHRLAVEAKGKDKRGNGTAAATATLTMSASSSGGTDVEVLTDLAITGKPAQFGRGLMKDVSDRLLGQFVACLEQQLSPDEQADPVPSASSPSAPGSSAPGSSALSSSRPGSSTPGSSTPGSSTLSSSTPGSSTPGSSALSSSALGPTDLSADREPPPAAAPVRTAPRPPRPAPQSAPTLDLGAAVLPVLIRSYWKPVAVGVIVLAAIIRRIRR